MMIRFHSCFIGIALLCCVGSAADLPAKPKEVPTENDVYAARAKELASRGLNFDQIFTELCKNVLTASETNHDLNLEDHARAMFGGLWLWTRKGGSPTFQGQNDKALHFIGGGAFEGFWDVGRMAAVTKERIDMNDPNNFFDLDDMAATMEGARWMDLAGDDNLNRAKRWIELWATGQYTLSRSLPKLHWGHMPPGTNAPDDKIQAVKTEIDAAIVLPPVPDQKPPAR